MSKKDEPAPDAGGDDDGPEGPVVIKMGEY